tara:strand:- start:300 stop:509 length:210 start_codon:yes stop_codon:yes gene_type:complete
MKVLGNKVVRNISLGKLGEEKIEMSVELSEKLIRKIREEYHIEKVEDVHIQHFFRDVLKDAATNLMKDQ